MVIVHISLGTGNQLFQYAYARALSETRSDVFIDHSSVVSTKFGYGRTDDIRDYSLNQFCISLRDAPVVDLEKYDFVNDIRIHNRIKDAFSRRRVGRNIYIKDKQNGFQEGMTKLPPNCYVDGWFQDERYFKHIREILLRELTPAKNEIPADLEKEVNNSNSVAIHVRRGDYLFNGMALNSAYYNLAIKEIQKSIHDAFFYVFTDDFRWAKRHLDFGQNYRFVNEDRSFNEANEIYLMSKCKSQIISNSTFSWWGAWLNTNPKKMIIAPKIWYPTQKAIVPSDWVVLK